MDRQCPWLPFILVDVKWQQASVEGGGRAEKRQGSGAGGMRGPQSAESRGRTSGASRDANSEQKTKGNNMNRIRALIPARGQTGTVVGYRPGASIRRPGSVSIMALRTHTFKAGIYPRISRNHANGVRRGRPRISRMTRIGNGEFNRRDCTGTKRHGRFYVDFTNEVTKIGTRARGGQRVFPSQRGRNDHK